MGLTKNSTGIKASAALNIKKRSPGDKIVALAGNPNVGKSTLFNSLTGLRQHTGNWPGKTVTNAQGCCKTRTSSYILVDLPGTYSLMAHSAEEEAARNFICFENPDVIVVVCDATCLERNLNLVLQTLEITQSVVVCVNLMDEARRKGIRVDLARLSKELGVPAVPAIARKKRSLDSLLRALDSPQGKTPVCVKYPDTVEAAVDILAPTLEGGFTGLNPRWLALRVLEGDALLLRELQSRFGEDFLRDPQISAALERANALLKEKGITPDTLKDLVVSALVRTAERISRASVSCEKASYAATDRRLDRILTGRVSAYPVMLALLGLALWLTIAGANYPSRALSFLLFKLQDLLSSLFAAMGAPDWLHGILVLGCYRVLAWVVSVMLPPMAIFFPLFTLLEDVGYLPRVAYNLDKPFKRCGACGKQALTMCMGLGCNAAGVVGCRIIDSPRERLLAVLTNSFIPCNGRFPALITLCGLLFAAGTPLSAAAVTGAVVLSVFMTFSVTRFLSKTLLKGVPSSFALEMPPYRPPQVGKVIVRSIFDRTLFVLGRAAAVAAPAGAVIWLAANINIKGLSLLSHAAGFLDPFARVFGLDGVILLAFILGLPANEIVLPLIIMSYTARGSLTELSTFPELKELLIANGWTWQTAACTLIFTLFHWPCSTTLLTVKKETGRLRWTLLAFALPTAAGLAACLALSALSRLLF